MKINVITLIILLITGNIYCQDVQDFDKNVFDIIQENTNYGAIHISQDSSINNLILRDIEINSKIGGIKDGYRIQIISVSGKNAREESHLAKLQFMTLFPDFDPNQIYSLYQPPFFKVRVGNYRNKFEALKFYKMVMKDFPNAYLVKGQIEFPNIE